VSKRKPPSTTPANPGGRLYPTEWPSEARARRALEKQLRQALTDPVFVHRAREVVLGMMHAVRLNSAPLPALKTGHANAEAFDKRLGKGNWWEHKGRLFWIEPVPEVQLAAAREVISRDEPALNRVDAKVSGSYAVRRTDPNQIEGKLLQLVPHAKGPSPRSAETAPTKESNTEEPNTVEDEP
jgi:hypothetical protein